MQKLSKMRQWIDVELTKTARILKTLGYPAENFGIHMVIMKLKNRVLCLTLA